MLLKILTALPRDAALWYDPALPLKLGCTVCPDLALCGGMRMAAGVFDCRFLCACARHDKRCSGVCRCNARAFLDRVDEVGGFELDNVPRCAPVGGRPLPTYVPIIYDGSDRNGPLDGGTVAVPLMSLFSRTSRTGRFETRDEMMEFFQLSTRTRIILTGVAADRALESWWSFGDRPRLIEYLRRFGIEMVTAPNYSLFTNVTRYDNLHNMKRIALTCAEFLAGGVRCALHVNARTDRDYERWGEFIAQREELTHVAFEFTTGAASPDRGAYHRDHLVALAARVGRPLNLVVRGGRRHRRQLTAAFASVSVLDADPYVKTKHRQRAHLLIGGDVEWRSSPTALGEALDDLLRHNIEVVRHLALLRRDWLRADHGDSKPGDVPPLLEPYSA